MIGSGYLVYALGFPTQKVSCKIIPLLKVALTHPFPAEFKELALTVIELLLLDNIVTLNEDCQVIGWFWLLLRFMTLELP
jgi:hypothetical protein